jgi:hypothetical protein
MTIEKGSRLRLHFVYKGITYWIILEKKSETEAELFAQVYYFYTDRANEVFHDTREIITTDAFDGLFGSFAEIKPKEEIIKNSHNGDSGGLSFHLSIDGDFGDIGFEIRGVTKYNRAERNLQKICAIIKNIFDLSGIKNTKYNIDLFEE